MKNLSPDQLVAALETQIDQDRSEMLAWMRNSSLHVKMAARAAIGGLCAGEDGPGRIIGRFAALAFDEIVTIVEKEKRT